jgi:hypothetical protein
MLSDGNCEKAGFAAAPRNKQVKQISVLAFVIRMKIKDQPVSDRTKKNREQQARQGHPDKNPFPAG